MKKAEDFRKAFGPVTPGFESAAKETIRELRAKETQKKRRTAGDWLRYRRPVLAMAMALVLFIGFLAVNDTLNLSGHTDEIRTGKAQYTVQPIETALAQGIEEGEGEGEGEGPADGAGIAADETVGQITYTFRDFMVGWAEKDTDRMLSLCADEWKANTPDTAQAIENLAASGKPRGYQFIQISGGQEDPVRTASVAVQWEAEDGSFIWKKHEIDFRRFSGGNDIYYVDPEGFAAGEPAEAVPEEDLVLLTKEGIIWDNMKAHLGISTDDLIPLNLSVEKQGIRVDVISGYVKGKNAYFMCKVQDIDGKYADYELEESPLWNDDVVSTSFLNLPSDPGANERTQMICLELSDLVPSSGGSLQVGYGDFRVKDGSRIDLLPLLKEHGGTEEGTALPNIERKYGGTEPPKDLKVLNYKKPLDIPLFRDVRLGGIGWIDGQLHVQLHNTGRDVIDLHNGRASAGSMNVSCSVTGKSFREIYNDYAPLSWDGDGDGWTEWTEHVLNCQPEDTEKMELIASIIVTDRILEGDWTVNVPLDPIRIPDDQVTAGAEEDGFGRGYDELDRFMVEWAQKNWGNAAVFAQYERTDKASSILEAVKEKLSFARPLSYQVNSVSVTDDSKVRKVTLTILADPGNGEEPQYQRCTLDIRRINNGQLMPDPLSLVVLGPAENDPAVKAVDLSKDAIFNRNLKGFDNPTELFPVSSVSCEKDGIRMELISGAVTPNEAWYVYSVQDLEMQSGDDSWEIYTLSDSIGAHRSFQDGELYHDPDKHQTIRMGHYEYWEKADLTDRMVTVQLSSVANGGRPRSGSWDLEFPLSLICPETKTAGGAETADAAMKEAAAAGTAVPETGLVQKMRDDYNQFNLWRFFGNWAQGNADDMVNGLNLTHKLHGEASKARVKELLESGTPLNFQINGIRPEGEEKVYTCTVELASGSGESSRCERFEVRINTDFENSRFGIDLNSFDHGQPAEMDPAKETFSLSRETYINVDLDYYYPGLRENLRPIGLTCERNGIRMELISGLLKDGEEYIFYSLEDPEGKYDLGSLDVSDLLDSIGKWETCSSSLVYRDRAARKAYFMWNPHYGNQPVDLTDRNVSLRLDYLDFLQNCWVNIAELAEQYGRTTEGVPTPEEVSEWDVQKGTFVTPEGAKVLDYRNPLDIQVLPNTKITGIGWIDDRLHVQFCVKNMTRASFYFNFVQRSELSWYDADNHGSYTDVIFDIGPGDEKIKEMYFCPNIGQEQIFGPWRIEFPLSTICPEAVRVLSEDEIIRDNLDQELPGVSEKLLPVHLASEKQGLRVEVVSGYVSGTDSCFVISVQDPEGKYTDYRKIPSFTSDMSDSIRGYDTRTLYTNEAEHKTYYAFIPTIYEPVTDEDRTVNAGIDLFRLEQWGIFDLLPLLRQYGETVEGVEQPDAIRRQEGVEQKLPRDLKILDYTRPLDIPLFGDVCLSGIGWIDDQLHVQLHNKGRSKIQRGNTTHYDVWSAGISCSAGDPYYIIEFDADYDDCAEWKEFIYNVKPDETDGLKLDTSLLVLTDVLDDGWTVEFPLSTICRETAEQVPQANADDAVRPVEELVEDYGNMNLDEREGKLVFDVRANTKVYTQDEIGYALKTDGSAEMMATSTFPGHREGFSIPEKVNGHVVTAIGEEALWGFDVKSITLPDTVKSIGRHAFRSCDKLETIRIPEGVTSIENSVFMDCISLKDVTIPSSVTAIGNRAFSGCLSLTGISIPSATVSLGDYAFVGCTGLTSVTLPEGLNTLGCYALYRCTGLETVEVPGGVSLVGNGAFKNCTGLQTARLQEGVTFLGADAFAGCGALETIELPESLRSVGERAFMGCVSLKKLALPEGLESIGRAAFADCTGLEELEIPESVTSIGENVFKGCENLTCTVTAGSYAMLYCVNNGITCIVK